MPRDVANLDTLESNFLLFDVADETTGLSSLHVQYKQERDSTQCETGSSAWAAPSLPATGGWALKVGEVIPEGTRGSEWGVRPWGASQGHPLAAQSWWAKQSTHQDLPHPVASILVRRKTNLTIFPFGFFIIWGMHEEITWSVQPNSHKLTEACGLNFTAFSYH